jgi:hypothetical protein
MSLSESVSVKDLTRTATDLFVLTKKSPGKYYAASEADNAPLTVFVGGSAMGNMVQASVSIKKRTAPVAGTSLSLGSFDGSVRVKALEGSGVTRTNVRIYCEYLASIITDDAFIDQLYDGQA